MQKLYIFFAIFCALLCVAYADDGKTLKLEVFESSSDYWMAVTDVDSAASTETIEVRQGSGAWSTMTGRDLHVWHFWTYQTANGAPFEFPLSFRLTSTTGESVTITSAVISFDGTLQTIDSLTNYQDSTESSTSEGVEPVVEDPVVDEPVDEAPVSEEPAGEASTEEAQPVEEQPVVEEPAEEPVNEDPVEEDPVEEEPAVDTPAEEQPASEVEEPVAEEPVAAVPASGCSAATKILVPLYSYPSSAWDTVIEGHSKVPTVVIVNPNSGPTTQPDSAFSTYMTKLDKAGIDMMGYVHTSYGARSISEVKSEINTYASNWPLLKGVFLDEASADSSQESYYKELYDYIMSMPGWTYDVINPGAVPTSGYFSASTTIVSLENAGSAGLGSTPSYASCDNKDHFSAIVHSVSTGSMESTVDGLLSKGYYGYVYITNGDAYNSLPPYYSAMVDYIASKSK